MHAVVEIYETLRSHGLCADQSEFSENWLGRSRGYLAYLRSSGTECCPISIQLLIERLWRRANDLRYPEPRLAEIREIMTLRKLQHKASTLTNFD
jgi:hypothetical protein